MYIGMALLCGTAFWKIDNNQASIQDRISILFFAGAFLTFMSIASFPARMLPITNSLIHFSIHLRNIFLFLIIFNKLIIVIEDRLLFVRERANAYYRVGAFALAHSLVQLPFALLMSLSFSLVAYWMVRNLFH